MNTPNLQLMSQEAITNALKKPGSILELLLIIQWAKQHGYGRASEAAEVAFRLEELLAPPALRKRKYRHGIAKVAKVLGISRQSVHAILSQPDGVAIVTGRIRAIAPSKSDDVAAGLEKLAAAFEKEAAQ